MRTLRRPERSSEEKRDRRKRRTIEWIAVIAVALSLSYLVRTYVLEAFYVPSGSMIPTLDIGDRIIVDKLFFSRSHLTRGDIIVFHHPVRDTMCGPPGEDLVKRVIATAGQTIWSKAGAIYINGHPIREPYLPPGTPLGPKPIPRQTIPSGDVYVLGDNRSISCDSRYWGPIPTSSIVGQVVAVIWRHGHPWLHTF